VFSCGNGGSLCDAMHFAEELTGRYHLDRPALPASAISDAGHMSCVGNDLGYEQVFSRYIEAHGRPGDCLLTITTSGTSKNVIRAVNAAKAQNMQVIALTGGAVPSWKRSAMSTCALRAAISPIAFRNCISRCCIF